MSASPQHIDKPEPRGQAVLAVLAIGAIYLALPRNLVLGPIWLLPTLIVILLVPTVLSHRMGRYSVNRALGMIINGITTLALIGSVILLVRTLPTHRSLPLQLLRAGGLLWLTNVIVFALWYWRLDGGGPTVRHKEKKFGSTSFLFPQMQIPQEERAQFACVRWRPRFVDYLFVAFTQSSTFGPTDSPLLARWAKVLAMIQILISLTIVVLLISRAIGVL
jgi:protein-S-isoprenylcysteine O-methyltransferase Ste14